MIGWPGKQSTLEGGWSGKGPLRRGYSSKGSEEVESSTQLSGVGTTRCQRQNHNKMNLNLNLISATRVNSTWITDLNVVKQNDTTASR